MEIVGLVLFATNLYHTSFEVPHAPAMAVYADDVSVPAVFTQVVEEVNNIAFPHSSLGCANEQIGNDKKITNLIVPLQMIWTLSIGFIIGWFFQVRTIQSKGS